jgi:hypothetical protein
MDNLVVEDYIQQWGNDHRSLATSYMTNSSQNDALVSIEYVKQNKGDVVFFFF